MIGLKGEHIVINQEVDVSLNRTMIGLKVTSLRVKPSTSLPFESNYDRIERSPTIQVSKYWLSLNRTMIGLKVNLWSVL